MSTRMHILWPDELVERVDEARGDVSRSKWLASLAQHALTPPEKKSIREAAEEASRRRNEP